MKIHTTGLILCTCFGIATGALAQNGASPPAAIPAPGTPPAANSNPAVNPPAAMATCRSRQKIHKCHPPSDRRPHRVAAGSLNNGTGQLFTTLDQGRKGYLNQGDVAPNSYLASHFEQCDSDHDSRLSQDEVGACLQQMPPDH